MTIRRLRLPTTSVLACLLVVGSGVASARAAQLSSSDKAFLTDTAEGAQYELAIAKLAAQQSTRDDVKSYAQTVVSDHDTMNSQLAALAQQNGVTLPDRMTAARQRDYDRLKAMSGNGFDAAYVQATKQVNQSDTRTEAKELRSTKNADVKRFVTELKATDAKHDALAQKLQQAAS